jgi:hypothetical protein
VSESQILADIRVALGDIPDAVFWRNNTGAAELASGHHRHFGLTKGSADLIGVVAGRFCALEVKTRSGRPTEEQIRFLALVRSKGGFAGVVRSAEDARAAIARCREGKSE